jgi:hypothetical protein
MAKQILNAFFGAVLLLLIKPLWVVASKLLENAATGWADDQIAAHFGITSPSGTKLFGWLIEWGPPLVGVIVVMTLYHLFYHYAFGTGLRARSASLAGVAPLSAPALASPKIAILFDKRAPYEESGVHQDRVHSTVRIGLKNTGGGTFSNCRVYVDKISPETPYPGGLPILLDNAGFSVRYDDPEKLVDVAVQWNHLGKKLFRFSAPMNGTFGDARMFTDGSVVRTIVVRVDATECQQNATFRIWTDDTMAVRMEHVS